MTSKTEYVTTADGARLYCERKGSGPPVIVANAVYLRHDFDGLTRSHDVVFYDLRNRGRSSTLDDPAQSARGIHHDVEDLEAVRRHFGFDRVRVIGHSYLGLMVVLWALENTEAAAGLVQIGPVSPRPGHEYPGDLSCRDEVLQRAGQTMSELGAAAAKLDPEAADFAERRRELCEEFWQGFSRMLVGRDELAEKAIPPDICELQNELNMRRHLAESIWPSVLALDLDPERLARLETPSLVVHGTLDRNAAYGGGREWALRLGDARLLTVEGAAHLPWLEEPELVNRSIETFLAGDWPEEAERVSRLERAG